MGRNKKGKNQEKVSAKSRENLSLEEKELEVVNSEEIDWKETDRKEPNPEYNAFLADLKLAKYEYRIKAGLLTEKEKEDRARILKFLGYES